ncbi:MAG: hypothetical protein H0X17_20605, partial [Deltaproteobacteria bacterium]|nr:hypothetical protein [Deltaproteobacteria bacterium]
MTAELELTVLQQVDHERGYLAGFVVTDEMIVALAGVSNRGPIVVASSNARDFAPRVTPRDHGLRAALVVADSIWACGEYGQLAVTRDHAATWTLQDTDTGACLYALALAHDGALWTVGDGGYAARLYGGPLARIDLGTTTRLSAVYAIRNEVVVLGFDGMIRRWRDGTTTPVACGTAKPLTGLVVTPKGTWIVIGDGGFVARSPDGQWYSRAHVGLDADLEAIAMLPDGTIVIVGDRGQILLSRDDGRSWQPLPSSFGPVHLWSIARFGGGVLIGGDAGLIVKLAQQGDATWADRKNVFGIEPPQVPPLDAVFLEGPAGFVEHGLTACLAALEDGDNEVAAAAA